jgi:hypothetical protein
MTVDDARTIWKPRGVTINGNAISGSLQASGRFRGITNGIA